MSDRAVWRDLLERADRFLDAHPDLAEAAKDCRGFGSGGAWMGHVLYRVRGREPRESDSDYAAASWGKYARSSCGALIAGWSVAFVSAWLVVPVAILAFYAIEARDVFLVPSIVDFGRRASRARRALIRRALIRRAGGVPTIVCVVLPIAAVMIFGGLTRRGAFRSWLLGCVAVVLWYVDLKDHRRTTAPIIEWGARYALSVRPIRIGPDPIGTARSGSVRLLYASDLHLGAWSSEASVRDLLRVVARERPDVVLLGGDLVDGQWGLGKLGGFVRRLSALAPVAAVPGNHDQFAGVDRVRAIVKESGGQWLPDRSLRVADIIVDGGPTREPRAGKFRVLCGHDPATIESAGSTDYDLILAGHLHGGQVKLFRRRGRDYPGAWFYRWTGPAFEEGSTTMLVSRGCADTLPVRFRCPREVLLCEVGGA